MGRIKELESEIRKAEKSRAEYVALFEAWTACAAMTDAAEQTKRAEYLAGALHSYDYKHPRPEQVTNSHVREHGSSLCTLLDLERNQYGKSITGAEACAMFFARHRAPVGEGSWLTHYRLRLTYETQMLEAQGGRAGVVEMEVGGTWRGMPIIKINRSNASDRVVSVNVIGPVAGRVNRRAITYTINEKPWGIFIREVERAEPGAYQPPSDESRASLAAFEKAKKEAAKRHKAEFGTCPLINPTDADAERLQAVLNANPVFRGDSASNVIRMTQEQFSARIGSSCRTETICETGLPHSTVYGENITRSDVYKVRLCSGGYQQCPRVVILTDKPQKGIPWDGVTAARGKHPTVESLRPRMGELAALVAADFRHDYAPLLVDARYAGLVRIQSLSQVSWTEAGRAEFDAYRAQLVTA